MRSLLALGLAIALAGCSNEQSGADASALTGSDTFLELVNDARLAVENGNLLEAGRLYDEARSLEPENPGLWVDIARLRFRGGEHLIAIDAADYALELNPQYAPAVLLKAQMVRDAHGLEESLPWFEAAVAADPRNPEVMADYAATLGDLGRYREMLRVVRELAEFAPNYPQVHYLQAVLAARGGDPVLASNLLNRSGLRAQGVPAAVMLGAIVDLQQGNYDTASEALDELAKRQPDNMRVKELLARALWLGGRDRELVDRYASQAASPSASPYLQMVVGRSLERMGERNRGLALIERAREPRSDQPIVLDGSGQGDASVPAITADLRRSVAAGNASGAGGQAANLIRRAPYSADFHALAGDVALARGDAKAALEAYEVAARVRRSWPLTRKIINAYRGFGDGLAAEVLLARYIAGDPQNTDALFLLAEESAQKEDWLRVSVLLDTAIALGAGNDLEVLALRAQAAQNLGDEAEAARFAAMLGELKPGEFLKR